jgi:hypothetical protein
VELQWSSRMGTFASAACIGMAKSWDSRTCCPKLGGDPGVGEVPTMFSVIPGRGKRAAAERTGPPQGSGHYSADGRMWWDDVKRRWFGISEGDDSLEIQVEEIGARSFLRSLLSTLSGSYGSAYFWFVGDARSADPRWPTYRVHGESFPVLRAEPFDEPGVRIPFGAEASHALNAFRECLVAHGWLSAGRGKHWYSYRYTRPNVDWESTPDRGQRQTEVHGAKPTSSNSPRSTPGISVDAPRYVPRFRPRVQW